MKGWLPRKGMKVVPHYGRLVVVLRRRLGVWDEHNEHWEAWSPTLRRVVTVAVGTDWMPWEGRK